MSLDRSQLLGGLYVVGFINGTLARVVDEAHSRGTTDLVVNTFDISAIVWVALVVGIAYLRRLPKTPISRLDTAAALGAAFAFLIPIGPLSWIALSGLAVHIILSSAPGSYPRRGGWILLALTIPTFWSRVLFSLFSDYFLVFDAILVGAIVGTERTGNAIAFADGSGYLWIAPGCSSLANVSLAVLCWVLFTQTLRSKRRSGQGWWLGAACAVVVLINVARISLIGLYSNQFDLLHGPVGETATNWLTLAAIVGISALGVRHDLPALHKRSSRASAGPQPFPQGPG